MEIPPFLERRTELEISLLFLGALLLFAVVVLGFEGNWPKIVRITAAFAGYGSILLAAARHQTPPSLVAFVLAAAVAGSISGLVRPEPFSPTLVATQTIAFGLLMGPVHWFGLRYQRRIREQLGVVSPAPPR